MSYAITRRRPARRHRAKGLSGWLDDFKAELDETLNKECPPGPKIAEWKAVSERLQSTWYPQPIVSADDLMKVVGAIMDMVNAVHNQVMLVRQDYDIDILSASEGAFNEIGKQAVDYTEAAKLARNLAAGFGAVAPVQAPGLKRWVIAAMNRMTEAMRSVEIATCTKPTWLSAAQAYQKVFDKVYATASSVVGVAVGLAQNAVKAVEGGLGIIGWMGKYPWVPVGIAAIILFKRYGVKV